ncbi:hypothetical protein DERP_005205 [Dermatophagoides pteronyssinus]|uniref:Uncharacterized protein n=1 Tax=Dermatophagoides pteronyssinus TaxID=6956 RepID=A0ABQ8JMP8_DERPT|nr:hypothetical protein DERP_005205 [Dermatophagoides pteronyssinus]
MFESSSIRFLWLIFLTIFSSSSSSSSLSLTINHDRKNDHYQKQNNNDNNDLKTQESFTTGALGPILGESYLDNNHNNGHYGGGISSYKNYGDSEHLDQGLNKYNGHHKRDKYGGKSGNHKDYNDHHVYQRNRGYGYEKHFVYDKEYSSGKSTGTKNGHHSYYDYLDNLYLSSSSNNQATTTIPVTKNQESTLNE